MPLPLAEIRNRAFRFAHEWQNEGDEIAEAQTFLNQFFDVFGVSRRRVATFEKRITHTDGRRGRIDLIWKGVVLVEMKSRGGNLDRAYDQARDYFPGLADHDLPRYLLVCDFGRFRLYDLEGDTRKEFILDELPSHIDLFGFISGWQVRHFEDEGPVNRDAAEQMGALHDALSEQGYEGHELEVLLVRLVFCLFAEDTAIFETAAFRGLLETRTAIDGSDLGSRLNELFEVLNTPEDARQRNLPEDLLAFQYVNGRLFEERLRPAAFNLGMREALLAAAALDWGKISPAIFGAMFQSIMDAELRRRLGAHYTSEANIMKALGPLFLDELRSKVESAVQSHSRRRLNELHDELVGIGVFDPACGCGNFLVVAYRELRRLELKILRALYPDNLPELDPNMIRLNVDRFYGIELHEFPAQIAQLALWLCDHQMNQEASHAFGRAVLRLPLRTAPHIEGRNALRADWHEIAPHDKVRFVVGNPPFVGARQKSAEQASDVAFVFGRSMGELDYVACWYRKAAEYIDGTEIRCALVSTNSLSQGEQPGILWTQLAPYRLNIQFAHRTFRWDNEARNVAAVHCVIIGFAQVPAPPDRRLFDYAHPRAAPNERRVENINAYLIDGPDVLVLPRREPLTATPPMMFGSMPNDGGHLLLTDREREELLARCPDARPWVHLCLGSREYLNGLARWCLWLNGISPDALRRMPLVLERVEAVRTYRAASKRPATKSLAATPSLFGEDRQPTTNYLLVPSASSEDRPHIPMGFMSPDMIATNLCLVIPNADLYLFGVLSSTMHMAWVRNVGGRLKSDYRYSATLTYNCFPFPAPSGDQRARIADAAQAVLDVRLRHNDSAPATLYNPETMPPDLVAAHRALDRTVDLAYRRQPFANDLDRTRFLLMEYQRMVAPLDARPALRRPRRRRRRRA
jgi:MmeI, DNA-methyltransferase domain/MmeI, target recognition domain/MmeI, N-terminal domain/MmeI, helicase spacer domain/MmeI, C-terminal domain